MMILQSLKCITIDQNTFLTHHGLVLSRFLIGKARVIMGKTIQPYADSIVFCHTDSMISKIKLPVKTGDKIGNLSYEGYCSDAVILNKAKRSGKYVV